MVHLSMQGNTIQRRKEYVCLSYRRIVSKDSKAQNRLCSVCLLVDKAEMQACVPAAVFV